jgi:signal transduction histidine kinase
VIIHEHFFLDALRRIISNGVKFSLKDEKRVRLSAEAVGDHVEVRVKDWGVGIPEDQLAHLFERFRQINREKMEQQGAGLGLVIAQALISCMNGDITVESSYGEGSEFTIHLPVAGQA